MCSSLAPPAVRVHTASLKPFAGLHCSVHTWRETRRSQESTLTTAAPSGACGSGSGPVFSHQPAQPCLPAASPSACVPAWSWSDLMIALHCSTQAWEKTVQSQESTLKASSTPPPAPCNNWVGKTGPQSLRCRALRVPESAHWWVNLAPRDSCGWCLPTGW